MSIEILLPLALLAVAPRPAPATAGTERAASEIVKRAQTLFDALAPGDVALWRDALTEDAVLIDEFGRRQTQAELLQQMKPLPAGFSGSIEVRHPNVHFYFATAVLDCEMFEREKVFDQQLTVRYLATLVFVRRGRDWKLAALETVTRGQRPATFGLSGDVHLRARAQVHRRGRGSRAEVPHPSRRARDAARTARKGCLHGCGGGAQSHPLSTRRARARHFPYRAAKV